MKLTKPALVLLGAALALACAQAAARGGGPPTSAQAARAKAGAAARKKAEAELAGKGREVYAANCARCHAADGTGRTQVGEMLETPDLTDAAWRRKRSAARMETSVARGLGQMPPFGRSLGREEIKAVIFYVRTLGK